MSSKHTQLNIRIFNKKFQSFKSWFSAPKKWGMNWYASSCSSKMVHIFTTFWEFFQCSESFTDHVFLFVDPNWSVSFLRRQVSIDLTKYMWDYNLWSKILLNHFFHLNLIQILRICSLNKTKTIKKSLINPLKITDR